ncbi:MAG: heme-binding protein [Alphaproteobacteria bacterium]|nr:heme-binding protein [Alphaproteobacteria bacterium]
MSVTLAEAELVADGTLAAERRNGAQPLTVVVLDAGGHVVVMKRSDNSGILRCEIANGKAYGALGMGLPSRILFDRAAANPNFFTVLAAASGGRLVPNPGGVLLRDAAGRIIGAVVVSGDTGDLDELCAMEGIRLAGLTGDCGKL